MNYENNDEILDGIIEAVDNKLSKEQIYTLGRMVIESYYAGREAGFKIGMRNQTTHSLNTETETV